MFRAGYTGRDALKLSIAGCMAYGFNGNFLCHAAEAVILMPWNQAL
jgi:hypothetical protein